MTSLVHRLIVAPKWIQWSVPLSEIRSGFRVLPEILRFGLKVTPGSLATGISDQIGTWVLGAFGSLAAVGAWNRAWALSQRFVELNFRLAEMVFPTLVERHVGEDRTGFDRALMDSLRYIAGGMLLPAAAGGGAAAGVMELFGPGFSRASTALAIILVLPAIAAMSNIQVDALLAVGRPLATTGLSIARLAATVPLTVVLTLSMGVTGTALGVVVGVGSSASSSGSFAPTSHSPCWPSGRLVSGGAARCLCIRLRRGPCPGLACSEGCSGCSPA